MSAPAAAPAPSQEDRKYARKAVFAAAIGYGLDGFDLLILSFALTGITASFNLTDPQAGSLATLTLLGAVLGGIVFGIMADKFGRVKVLTFSVLIFAVFTGLSALATGYWDLAAYRFIAGIGIGGEFGIGMTLAAEAVPARWRARATSWVGMGFQLGVLAAALLSAPVIAAFGWRALFVIGALPAIYAMFVRRGVSEPQKFTAATAKPKLREAIAPLVSSPKAVRISIAMILLSSVQNFGYFGIMTWLPSYLSNRYGMSLNGTSLWTAVTVAGMMTGIIIFGQVADRVSRRAAFWIFQIGAAVSVLAYSQISNHALLMAAGFIMGLFANGTIGGYGALMAEHYPTHARATAQNILFNIGRGVGGFAPLVIALLANSFGFPAALAMLPVIYLIGFAAMFMVPERRGTELQ